jgi:hypothetical protein
MQNGSRPGHDMRRAHFHAIRRHTLLGTNLARSWDQPYERKYAMGCAFLRRVGCGHVLRVTGVGRVQELVHRHVVEAKLPQLGTALRQLRWATAT